VSYQIRFTRQAKKDIKTLTPKLRNKLKDILRNKLSTEPYSGKVLMGELKGYYSIRLNFKDRIVYSVHDKELVVLIIRAKTHYDE